MDCVLVLQMCECGHNCPINTDERAGVQKFGAQQTGDSGKGGTKILANQAH